MRALGGLLAPLLFLWPAVGLVLLGWFSRRLYDKLRGKGYAHGGTVKPLRTFDAKGASRVKSKKVGSDGRSSRRTSETLWPRGRLGGVDGCGDTCLRPLPGATEDSPGGREAGQDPSSTDQERKSSDDASEG